MVLVSQTIRILAIIILLILAQLIPFIALDGDFQIARIVYTIIISLIYLIVLYNPSFLSKYISHYVTLTSIAINIIGYVSLQAFESRLSQGTNQETQNYQQSDCNKQIQNILSYDEQTINELSINLRYYIGTLNIINFFPGINQFHRIISLSVSVVLWTFQQGGVLTRLMSVSFLIEIFLLYYHMNVIERILNEKLVGLNRKNQQDNRQNSADQGLNTLQSGDQRNVGEIQQILYQANFKSTGRKKWKIDDILFERDSIYEIIKKFANFNMIIYTSEMKVKFMTQSLRKFLVSIENNLKLDEEENIKKIFQKIIISDKENLYDHLKKTINQWYNQGEINSSFEMLCNRDRIYSLSNCQVNLEKYQLYISEIQVDQQQCLLILFNTQEDASTFNQYKHKMINSISHDLKTPLNGMILLLDILKEQIKNNFLKPSDQKFPSFLSVSPLSANVKIQSNEQNASSSHQINLILVNKQNSQQIQNSSVNILNMDGQLIKQDSQFDTAEVLQFNQNKEQSQNNYNTDQKNQQKYQNETKEQSNVLPGNIQLMKNSHSDIVNIDKPKDFQHKLQHSMSQIQENQILKIQQKSLNNNEQQQQQQQYVYNVKKQSFINKYEPNMSTSLLPLQEEEEIFFEDQKKSRRDTLTDDDWFVQSSLKAATHNHLYHNNFSNQQVYKTFVPSPCSSKVKKAEQQEQVIKIQPSKQDSSMQQIKLGSDLKMNELKQISNHTFQEDSFGTSDKLHNNFIVIKVPESNHSLTEGQTITEHHPFLQQNNHFQTTQSDNEDQLGNFKLKKNKLILTDINKNQDQNQSSSQSSTNKSPDFLEPTLKQNQLLIQGQLQQQQQQINKPKLFEDQQNKYAKDQNDENIQILETDEAHNQVKFTQIQDNYLAKISPVGCSVQNSRQFQAKDKTQNNMSFYQEKKYNNQNLKIQLHKEFSESQLSPQKSNLAVNQQDLVNDSPNQNLLFTPQTQYSQQIQKQQELISINQDIFSNNQAESQQKITQQEKEIARNSFNTMQKQQIPAEQNSNINLIQSKSNNQNNNQSTNTSNKQLTGSSPSSTQQGYKHQLKDQQVESQKQIIQMKSLSNTSISNNTPKSEILILSKEKMISNNSQDNIQQLQNTENIQRLNNKIFSSTPKNYSQFHSCNDTGLKKDSLNQDQTHEDQNTKQPKDIFKFQVMNEKDRITEIEEKSIEGDIYSSIQKNYFAKVDGQQEISPNQNNKKMQEQQQNFKSLKQLPKKSISNINKFQYSKTTGIASSLSIPFNIQNSQRSFTYSYSGNERKFISKINQKNETKETIFNQTPNQLVKSNSQNYFTSTTLRDIHILYQYICNIQKNGYLLESRINDLIDYSTLLNKNDLSLNCTQFDLMEILTEMRELFELQAKKKNCKLIIPNLKLDLKNDKPRIKQILINIIGNAIKFTFEGFVRIIVQNCESPSNLIQIIVQDTGIGIPDSIKKNILNFAAHIQQVKDDNRQGVGIGLEICSRLCQIIGPLDQEIQVESKVNIGSSFSFLIYLNHPLYIEERDLSSNHYNQKRRRRQQISYTTIRSEIEHENNIQIPLFETKHNLLAKKQSPQSQNLDQAPQNSKDQIQEIGETQIKHLESSNTSILVKKEANILNDQNDTILIVDDVAFNLIALRNTLKLIYPNLNILEAQNGKQAVEIVHEYNGKIDLIIMDINMPIMDGFQAISIINQEIKDQVLEYVPIIAHTAFDNNEDKQKCFQLGAKGFLPKPVKKIELEKSVRAFLSPQSQQI
ncbi:response regulator receiver domain protein (macronuclear) [Tetrahymena thermophila SB210]|uniref:Response regulator receiver domain protein n=1 Tax=Tetrahymena thermophila (strain SB210) TaxID=312017 RepID=Q22CX2_TETTS|nr:response regulator receiver domain protein [Tetrahymena thermophila SB210]EAR83147.2 response regulator receiver domain protein [Tetrahymena thermophila SB210]|eukprot:XP_001030810.2 response regulator receiver domain protein [Tetrahymena thermophila SB210]